MATVRQRVHKYNGANYDIVHYETEASVVLYTKNSQSTVEGALDTLFTDVSNRSRLNHTHSALDITREVLPVQYGGTGTFSLDQGNALIGNGSEGITSLEIDSDVGGVANSSHLITSGAVRAGLNTKSNTGHTHSTSSITNFASAVQNVTINASQISGILGIENIPSSAQERVVTVANKNARFALTTEDVQLGDVVREANTGLMYYVTDIYNLNSEDGYNQFTAGAATTVPWSGVTGKPSTYTPSAHTQAWSTITNTPTTLNGYGITDSASSTHAHGNITTAGKIGTTSGYSVYTTTDGLVTAGTLATTSPSASGNTVSFIDTVSQDSKGKITATKKTVTSATDSTAGITKIGASGGAATFEHVHGNITNDGKVGSTSGYSVYTTTGGAVTAGTLATSDPSASGTSLTFIATASQDAKGKMTLTKKTVATMVASGTNGAGGLVPSPGTTEGSTKYLREDATWQVPPNTNTHYISKNVVGAASNATANATATNGNVYLNHLEESTVKSTHNIAGSGATSVTSDASGNITISSTDTKNTAGTTNSTSKLFLAGATSQAANPQTYSNSSVYTTNGTMYATTFSGSGASLTNLNASKLSSGTIPTDRLPITGIYAVKGTQTAVTGSWTGTIPVAALFDGLTIAYYLPYNGSGNATLNLTLSGGGTTGAIEVYYSGATRMTTHYAAGSTILLTYWGAGSISVAGTATTAARWTRCDYNSNTNTTYTLATGDSNGQIKVTPSSGDAYNVDVKGLASGAYAAAYTHPTTAGNKHVPSGGSDGQFLGWSAAGTAKWVDNPNTNTHYTTHLYAGSGTAANAATTNGNTKITVVDNTTVRDSVVIKGTGATTVTSDASGNITINSTDNNTTYSNFTKATSSAAGTAGLVPAPAAGKQASFLRGDAIWAVPTNTTYSNFVKSGSTAAAGLVPSPGTTAGTTKYLREDATWAVPPDTNTTYSAFVKSGSTAAAGLVPKPSTTAGTTKYLREDASWQVPPNTTYTASTTSIGSASAGTAIAADDITSWSAGTAASASVDSGVLSITNGTAPSLSYTARSIPNISVTSKTVVTGITAS